MALYCSKCGAYPQTSAGACLCQQQIHYIDSVGSEIEVNKALAGIVAENQTLRARNAELEAELKLIKDNRIERLISKMRVKCDNFGAGCIESGCPCKALRFIQQHNDLYDDLNAAVAALEASDGT